MKKLALAAFLIGGCNSAAGPTSIPTPLVQGLHLTQIASYQSLKATLMKDGNAVDTPEVPLIAGKPLRLRVFVQPDDNFDGHEVNVHFDLTANGTALPSIDVPKSFTAASTEGDFDSTAFIDLTADQVTTDLTYLVSLREEKPGSDVQNDSAIWPAVDSQATAGVQDTGSGEHVVVIPIEYDADGSGRMPDTGGDMLAQLQTRMPSSIR